MNKACTIYCTNGNCFNEGACQKHMKAIHLRIDDDQLEHLQRLAKKWDRSVAYVIRTIIRHGLAYDPEEQPTVHEPSYPHIPTFDPGGVGRRASRRDA